MFSWVLRKSALKMLTVQMIQGDNEFTKKICNGIMLTTKTFKNGFTVKNIHVVTTANTENLTCT